MNTGCSYWIADNLAFDYWFWFLCLKVDGGYDEWGNYSECSATCGVGNQVRMRTCTNPVPQHGGKPCMGSHSESRECNTQPCPGTTVILYWCSTLQIFFKWSRVIEVFFWILTVLLRNELYRLMCWDFFLDTSPLTIKLSIRNNRVLVLLLFMGLIWTVY